MQLWERLRKFTGAKPPVLRRELVIMLEGGVGQSSTVSAIVDAINNAEPKRDFLVE